MSNNHGTKKSELPSRIYPKTNISKAYYRYVVDNIEHAPLVKISTLTTASIMTAICILLGAIIWFAQFTPGNLIKTTGNVTNVSTNKAEMTRPANSFVTFSFQTQQQDSKSVRQVTSTDSNYATGDTIQIGYHPNNPNYARILDNTTPSLASLILWSGPGLIIIWLSLVAYIRYIQRQNLIWEAAEAADID